jgi:hypothetical protein
MTTALEMPKGVSFSPAVLTIRAKRTDIDAFSKCELDFNRSGERTQIPTHWK